MEGSGRVSTTSDVVRLGFPRGTSAGELDPEWVIKTEESLGQAFDEAFVAFLCDQNGGPPHSRLLEVEGRVKVLERFLCCVDPKVNAIDGIYDIGVVRKMLGARLAPTLVPFAVLFPGDFLCFDHAVSGRPAVVWWKHEAPAGAPSPSTVPVARDFDSLIAMLRADS
jgi:hypothetical protein